MMFVKPMNVPHCQFSPQAADAMRPAPRAMDGARKFHEFDDPAFQAVYCRKLDDDLMSAELAVEGVHCASCVATLERLPVVLTGVCQSRLEFRRSLLRVVFDPRRVRLSDIAATIDSFGYRPHAARGVPQREQRRLEDRRMFIRIGVAGACAGNIMLLYIALYAGMFQGIDAATEQAFRWISMGLNTLCLAWPANVFARSAIAAIRTRTVQLDVPIALSLYLGGMWGAWKTIAGQGDIYFDSISALVFFLLVGRCVQQRQQRQAADSMELLFSLTPSVAHRVEQDGEIHEVSIESLAPGQMVEVRAGESVPADGLILEGASAVDNSLLTGESRPCQLSAGDRIFAGATNLSMALRVRVEAIGSTSRIGRLMALVEEASKRRAPIVRLADRWGRLLLWILLGLASITLALWWALAGLVVAVDRAAALLIATCPCGLGLATPLAMTVALGRAARRGFLVKGGDAIEALGSAGRQGYVVLDKTGTVTTGQPAVVGIFGDQTAIGQAAAIERTSSHPTAVAIREAAGADIELPHADGVTEYQGAGVVGRVGSNRIMVGTEALMRAQHCSIPAECEQAAAGFLNDQQSPAFIARDGVVVSVLAIGDMIRPDAHEAVESVRRRGWRVRLLSGDHPRIVAHVGARLGFHSDECEGGVTPENKAERIASLMETGASVIMIGDGVNDAAALATATVGVAVRGGAEASMAAADVMLAPGGLKPVIDLFDGAAAAMRTIHGTIATSLAYNVVAAALCMTGVISPLIAAILMPASSFTVVAISLGSRAFRATGGSSR